MDISGIILYWLAIGVFITYLAMLSIEPWENQVFTGGVILSSVIFWPISIFVGASYILVQLVRSLMDI